MGANGVSMAFRDSMHDPSSKYLGSEENQEEILSHLTPELRREWNDFGHRRIEPAFQDRVFVVYQPAGKGGAQQRQRPPKIITTIRLLSFTARDEFGCVVRLLDETTNKTMEFGHLPAKLFDYPIFVAVPPVLNLRWDAHRHAGKIQRSLSYVIFVKTRNKAEFFSTSNLYMETPNRMQELFPHLDLKLDL